MTHFVVEQEVYTGPLELLLDLIEKRKLLINEVSLAKVAEDFLAYLTTHPELPVAETAQFILVASTLVLIKSRSLLPVLTLSEEEQASVEDLEARLKEYQEYRRLSVELRARFDAVRLYPRRVVRRTPLPVFSPDPNMTQEALYAAITRALAAVPKEPQLPSVTVRTVVSIEEMMDRLMLRVQEGLRTSFRDVSGMGKEEKVHVVVSFLAVLELVKQGAVRVEQYARFGEIILHNDTVGVPRYG